MEGRWEEGQGEDLDALFDPQFACSEEDFKFCKGYGKSSDSYERGKHAAAYRVVNRMAEEAKGKDEGKEQPAVWRHRPASRLAAKASLFWKDVGWHSNRTSCV